MSRTFSVAIAVVSFALLTASKPLPVPPDTLTSLQFSVNNAPGVTENLRHPLSVKLDAVRAAIAKTEIAVACAALGDFRDQVVAKRGKSIPEATADLWVVLADQLSNGNGCSGTC